LMLVMALIGAHAGEVEMLEHESVAVTPVPAKKKSVATLTKTPAKPASKPVLPDPPQVKAPAPPSRLDKLLKKRKSKRLFETAHKLREKFLEAKVEKKAADAVLARKKALYDKSLTAQAEAKSARTAAAKKQKVLEQAIVGEHVKVALAKTEAKKINTAYKLAKAMVRGTQVEEQVAGAFAQSGGARLNLKKAESSRKRATGRWKKAKADIEARRKGVVQAKLAKVAGAANLKSKLDSLAKTHHALNKADKEFSAAQYKIDHLQDTLETEKEDVVQYSAEAHESDKAYRTAHKLAMAAAMKLNKDKKGEEATLEALLGDPDEERKEALAVVQDQDGISQKGYALVAPAGQVSADYIKRFDAMPIGDNGRNPILEAEASASVKDTATAAAAMKAATTPGPATLAAAKIVP